MSGSERQEPEDREKMRKIVRINYKYKTAERGQMRARKMRTLLVLLNRVTFHGSLFSPKIGVLMGVGVGEVVAE